MFKKKAVVFCVVGLLLLTSIGFTGCQASTNDSGDDIKELVFATGSTGGSWYPLGASLAESWRKDCGLIVHVEQGGGEANIKGVSEGVFDIGLSYGLSTNQAVNGLGSFKGEVYEDFLGVAALYPSVLQAVVWADSKINSIEDFKGKSISPGPRGFTGETVAAMILEECGMNYNDMRKVEHVGYTDSVALLKDRHIDVYWPATSVPATAITEISVTGPGVRIIPLSEVVVSALEKRNPGIMRSIISPNTYRGQTEEVLTVEVSTVLIARADLPEELVYNLTKSLLKNREALISSNNVLETFTAEKAPLALGVRLHPGAERYYKEIGVLK